MIRAAPSASRRTKNYLHNHPGMVIADRRVPQCMGVECYFVRAPDGWFGWVPVEELIVGDGKGGSK